MKTLFTSLRARVCRLQPSAPPRNGFTLIELLVVIVIIAILIAMLGGAYAQARNHAKRGRAETQLRELVKAWTEYYMTYNRWPPFLTGLSDRPMTEANLSPLFATLSTGAVNPWNTNGIPFLSIKILPGETYCDPWGNPYKITFKSGTDGQDMALRIAVGFPNRDRYR